jgi:hypothetical protein
VTVGQAGNKASMFRLGDFVLFELKPRFAAGAFSSVASAQLVGCLLWQPPARGPQSICRQAFWLYVSA